MSWAAAETPGPAAGGWAPGTDARALTYVRRAVDEFTAHLKAAYPDDPRTKALLAKLRDVRLLYPSDASPSSDATSYNSGVFSHTTGTLMVAPRDGRGAPRPEGSLNKTILHELAHATRFKHLGESSHSTAWKSAFVWFLTVATGELGWHVDLPCSVVTFYGLSQSDCPMCAWASSAAGGACGAYTGPPEH